MWFHIALKSTIKRPCFQKLTNEKHLFFSLHLSFKLLTECTIQGPCFQKFKEHVYVMIPLHHAPSPNTKS